MKQRLIDFFEYSIFRMPLKYSIPLTIVSITVFVISMFGDSVIIIPINIIGLFFTVLFSANIFQKKFAKERSKENIESLERLKERLTNELQPVSLKTGKEELINTVVKKAPYVFKAKIENDVIYYQFETTDGEVIDSGETTNFIWFERRII